VFWGCQTIAVTYAKDLRRRSCWIYLC